MTTRLEPGTPAPDFSLLDQDGRSVSLADLRGRKVILYFYPAAMTPGCTTQACALRDAWPKFDGKAEIFGVSVDSAASHQKFITKHSLPFPLLVDDEKKIVGDYGVWVEKSMYGKKYMGAERSTFVIGPDGYIKAILRKVKPGEHVKQLLAEL